MPHKIIMLGRAGVGKTSIKNIFFTNADPNVLLNTPLAPTRGIITSNYKWMDLELGIFDTSGQELLDLLDSKEEILSLFEGASAILYLFEYEFWVSETSIFIEEIKKIYNIINENEINTQIYLVFNKIDLISHHIGGIFDLISINLNLQLNFPKALRVLFTSIQPDLLYTTFNALGVILSSFSSETSRIKAKVDNILKDLTKSICFITNNKNVIITQSITPDFNTKLIFSLHKEIDLLIHTSKIKLLNESGLLLTNLGSTFLNIFIENLNEINPNLKRIIIFSETTKKDELGKIVKEFKENLKEK